MDLVSFGMLARCHFRVQDQKLKRLEQLVFYNTRMAFHADAKAAKKWDKQWRTQQQLVQENKKHRSMLLKQFVK